MLWGKGSNKILNSKNFFDLFLKFLNKIIKNNSSCRKKNTLKK